MAEESFAADASPGQHYLNRELSTLDFNGRVLALAENPDLPLLERVKFFAIFATNMDEFFQVRVAGLMDQLAAGIGTAPDRLSVSDQLKAIRAGTEVLLERRARAFVSDVLPGLASHGIELCGWGSLSQADQEWASRVFQERIFPVLTPLAVDPGHPFPYISNLSLNLAVIVRDPSGGERRFARVKVPPLLPGLLAMPDGRRFVTLEQVIAAHLGDLFPGMEIVSHHPFRVTRNADLALEEDEADDLLVALEVELRRRRFGRALRVEIRPGMPPEFLELLLDQLELDPANVYESHAPLGLRDLWALYALDRPELKHEGWSPLTPPRLLDGDHVGDVFSVIRQGDVLLHHPYESFTDSVEQFIDQAANDPHVIAIKQTLYRTSGDSPIVASLIRAAEQGKQVVALVELKARFDEAANIEWAKALEDAGVHVVYGIVGLKTHCKVCLVVREEAGEMRRYVHLASGNYNGKTARVYEDFGILTCNDEVAKDVGELFNYLTGFSKGGEYRRIVVSPAHVRDRVVELIRAQAERGARGRILVKVNGLTDPTVIDALYEASRAGVEIRLIVRTLCCLRPGIEGLSENITVHSVVGEFLEHSRLFIFSRPGEPDFEVYLGSADLMERNLDRRVEAIVPIENPSMRADLLEAFDITWSDDVFTWILGSDRRWRRLQSVNGVVAQSELKSRALERARRAES